MTSTPLAYILKRLKEEHDLRAKRSPDEWWVTDLCLCPKKRELQLNYPELMTWEPDPRLIHAVLLHYGVEYLLEAYYISRNWDAQIEREFSKRINVNGEPLTVKGRPDIYATDLYGPACEIVEVKTGRAGQEIPHPHHVHQVRYYLWLTGAQTGWLLYVLPDRLCEFRVTEPFTDEDVINAMRATEAPRYDWECKYCQLKPFCAVASRREGK